MTPLSHENPVSAKETALLKAGNALWTRLESWISNNSGFCHPLDEAAIKKWREVSGFTPGSKEAL